MRSDYVIHQVLVARELGGAALFALRLAASLRGQVAGSHVWVPGPGRARRQAEELGLIVHEYDAEGVFGPGRVRAAWGNWVFARKLRRFGRGIVHVHSPAHYGALRLGLRFSGLKRVAHVQLEEDQATYRWAFRAPPDLIVTCAHFLEGLVRRALPESSRERQWIVPVPNSVDLERFRPGDQGEARRRIGAPAGTPLLLMLANLAPHKGQETALRAVAALKRRGVHVTCWLAGLERGGEGWYTEKLRGLIGELEIADRVRLLGHRDDTPDLLRAADLFLLPSTNEGLPLSLLEAQASKVPVLASPTAGIPEAVRDGATGFLIAADDVQGYADRVATLLADRGLYQRVAAQAFEETTRAYNWQSCRQRLWECYQQLMGGDNGHGSPVAARPEPLPCLPSSGSTA